MIKILLLSISLFIFLGPLRSQTPELSVQTGHTGTINAIKFSPDNTIFATTSIDNTIILWEFKSGKQINILSGHKAAVNSIHFNSKKDELYSVADDGYLIIWDWKNGKIIREEKIASAPLKMVVLDEKENKLFIASSSIYVFDLKSTSVSSLDFASPDLITSLDINPSKNQIVFGNETTKSFFLFDYSKNQLIKKLPYNINALRFSRDGERFYASNNKGELRMWDLNNFTVFPNYNLVETYSKRNSLIYAIESDSSNFYMANKEKLIYCYNKKGQVNHILKGHTKNPKCMALSNDGKILLSAGEDQRVYVWNTSNGKLISTIEGAVKNIAGIGYTKNGQGLVLAFELGQIKYWNLTSNSFVNYYLSSNKKGWQYNLMKIDSVSDTKVFLDAAFYRTFKRTTILREVICYKVIWDITTNKASISDYKKKKYSENDNVRNLLESNQTTETAYNFKTKMSAQYKGNEILLFSDKKLNPVLTINTKHKGGINCIAFNEAYNYITTVGKDGMLKNWSMSGELTGIMGTFNEKDFLLMNKDNYYYTSKGALKDIGYRIESSIFSFDQFDLKYNRPDLALRGFPHIDTVLLNSYKSAYYKRLKKSDLKEEDIIVNQNAPSIKIDLPANLYTESDKFEFTIHAKDTLLLLEKLFISINGVPVGNKYGENIGQKSLNKKISLELNADENNIQVYVTNSNKANSLKQSFKIILTSKSQKPDLYLACIGAGHYEQKSFNLEYAEKDAKDVIELFKKSKLYGNIYTKLLVDASVTKDSLEKVKSFFSGAKINDIVILFVAGHGILDKNLDYYLSTYDVDFADPARKGISYESLDNIMDNIKSRKKVLLIDACHSGEIDKDEVEIKPEENLKSDDKLTFRAAGTSIKKKGDIKLKSSFELSKVLFADMRLNNGTTVISSAGGAEYALESKEWKNGAFTFCFLKGLKKKKADVNSDGEISLSELQEYLSITVSDLTDGKQISTSRAENLQNDFRIW
ncbi:MAG: caspase family protein [Bacteroidota bacterium]|nr:caspase family protein [Bacteroidota bacterium]